MFISKVSLNADSVNARTQALFHQHQHKVFQQTDRIFMWLLLFEWLAGMAVSICLSPLTWNGDQASIHPHVWTSIFLGAGITFPGIILALKMPGQQITRHAIAISQMLFSALLIHLTGGRIESHFHIFGSLAFLSFYRDWKVFIPAVLVVATDHILRGIYFPQSVYGVSVIEPWRWVEHVWWVIFEVAVLTKICLLNQKEMLLIAQRQAELEETNLNIETLVEKRTDELQISKSWATTQYQILQALSEKNSWDDALEQILNSILRHVAKDSQRCWGAFWRRSEDSLDLRCTEQLQYPPSSFDEFSEASNSFNIAKNSGLVGSVWANKKSKEVDFLKGDIDFSRLEQGRASGFVSGVAFPVWDSEKFFGVFEIFLDRRAEWDLEALNSLGQRIGQIASRKEAEKEKDHLANVVEQSSDAILTTSASGLITSWNKGAEKILGFSSDSVINRHLSMLIDFQKNPDLEKLFSNSLRQGRTIDAYETALQSQHGKMVDVILFAVPWFDDDGQYEGCSLTLHNVTQRKEAERKVSEFYSVVSHELRTPLTSIRGVLGLLEGKAIEPDSDEAAELISVARTSSDRLIRLINDMLDLKKIEAGKMELDKAEVAIPELIEHTVKTLSGLASESNVQLESFCYTDASVVVDWDKVVQIITNLISNAVKFSPEKASVVLKATAVGRNTVRISVIDKGPGIAAHNVGRLFDKFHQIDSSDSRPVGGTGLGLAISKALVEQHGGTIGVTTAPGHGSEFWFELPSTGDASPKRDEKEIRSLRLIEMDSFPSSEDRLNLQVETCPVVTAGRSLEKLLRNDSCEYHPGYESDSRRASKILIVDDDAELRLVLSKQIKRSGLECLEAANGNEAIELISMHSPDLIMLDVIMPELDGFGLVKALQEDSVSSKLPLIIYSCKDLCKSERELLVLGVTRFLQKGEASGEDLNNTIDELLTAMSPIIESDYRNVDENRLNFETTRQNCKELVS